MNKQDKQNNIELHSEEFQEILGAVPSWILRRGISLFLIIILILLTGSIFFKYPNTISTSMTLTSTIPPAALVAKSAGRLTELMIEDNQLVKTGEYLAIIENTARKEDALFVKNYLQSFQIEIENDTLLRIPPKDLNMGNMQSLYNSFYITLVEYNEFKTLQYFPTKTEYLKGSLSMQEIQHKQLINQQNIIFEQFKMIKNQYKRDSTLYQSGLLSEEEIETARNQYLQGILNLENIKLSIHNTETAIQQTKENMFEILYQSLEKENMLKTQLRTQLSQLLNEIESWEQTYVLISPIEGNVIFTNYWVENQNIKAGEDVFHINPLIKGELIGKALLPMSGSGKVQKGQKVNIRFLNFPDSEYGIVRGVVKKISLIPSKDQEKNYNVEIELPYGLTTTYEHILPYLPEMEAEAEIITEDLSLLERFFMPLKKIIKESL